MHIHHAQRKHILHSLDALLYQLHTLSFFLSPALWVYLARVISQFQFSRPRQMDPKRSLRFWFFLAFLFNLGSLWTHTLDSGQIQRSVIVDFVGMGRPPSKFHVLFLDCLIILLEMLLTTIAYEIAVSEEPSPTGTETTSPNVSDEYAAHTSLFRDETDGGSWTEAQLIVDIRFSSILERLRTPPPPPPSGRDDPEGGLLPLPNTTPWRLSNSLRMVMQARVRAREQVGQGQEGADETDRSRNIPGGLDVNERT